jgi:hypothetical protein
MKIKSLKLILSALSLMVLFSSCAKDPVEPEDPNSPPVVNPDPPFFRWKTSANVTTESDSSHAYVNSKVIFAFKNGNSNSIEINLSSMNTGSYVISSVSGNQFEYQLGQTIYSGTTGTVNITQSTTSKLDGNFSCSLTGGTLSAISGSFSGIAKRYN